MNLMKFSRMDLADCATSEVLVNVPIDEGALALDIRHHRARSSEKRRDRRRLIDVSTPQFRTILIHEAADAVGGGSRSDTNLPFSAAAAHPSPHSSQVPFVVKGQDCISGKAGW
jgi:hypothetical protein